MSRPTPPTYKPRNWPSYSDAVNDDGKREVLGVATGPSEAETFWTGFLRSLADRGLRGVKLVIGL